MTIFENIFGKMGLSIAAGHEELRRLNARINTLTAAVNSQSNTVNVSGGGATLWQGHLNAMIPVTIANGLDFVRLELISYTTAGGNWASGSTVVTPAFPSALNVVDIALTGGDFTLTASENCDIWISFFSSPMVAGGIVGPRGVIGPTGQAGADGADGDNWNGWTNLTLAANVSEYNGAEPSRIRLSSNGHNAQLHVQVRPFSTWNGTITIANLGISPRPTRIIRFIGIFGNGNAYPAAITTTGALALYNVLNENTSQYIPISLIYPLD